MMKTFLVQLNNLFLKNYYNIIFINTLIFNSRSYEKLIKKIKICDVSCYIYESQLNNIGRQLQATE